MNNTLYIGIDLGTSNTEITVLQNGEIETLSINQNLTTDGRRQRASKRLPSLVCFADDGTPMFGEVYRRPIQDIQNYTGRVVMNTKRMLLTRPETKVYHVKNGDGSTSLYSPQDIATLLLQRCAQEAVAQKQYKPSDKVMVTVPCGYQMDQVQATLRAARNAGFNLDDRAELITEPVAALIEYIIYQNPRFTPDDPRYIDLSKPQNVLVYDLGGGTLDLSIVRIQLIDGVYHFSELANNNSERDRTIGGADFDAAVAAYLRDSLLNKAARANHCTVEDIIDRLDDTDFYSYDTMLELLHSRAYDMKHTLQRNPEYISLILSSDEDVHNENSVTLAVTLSGQSSIEDDTVSYTDIVRNFITEGTDRNILDPIPSVLNDAFLDGRKLDPGEVDKILITGGMCKFSVVRNVLLSYLEKLWNDPENPIRLNVLESDAGLAAVSIGAACSHRLNIENHNEHLSKNYYLDVAEGLPQNLLARGAYQPITLLNPTEALFEIYCGTSLADPDMRRQYYYHKRFQPPLEGTAQISFFLDRKPNGESNLIGTIHRPGKPDEDICFTEQSVQAEEVLPAAPTLTRFRRGRRGELFPSGVYSGGLTHSAPEGTEKRLFLNSSSDADHSVSNTFRQILYLMDIEDKQDSRNAYAGMPIPNRFNTLTELLKAYYLSQPDGKRIPMFQYALYAMRQLPLSEIAVPEFPLLPKHGGLMRTRKQENLTAGLCQFCELIGSLLTMQEVPGQRKEQLEEELRYSITEWHWHELFQLCISIAQKAGAASLADLLCRRLLRRKRALEIRNPEAMKAPGNDTAPRLLSVFGNALQGGHTLTDTQTETLEQLLRGRYCAVSNGWLAGRQVSAVLGQMEDSVRQRITANNPPLAAPGTAGPSPEDVTSPDGLLDKAFQSAHDPNNTDLRPKYWKRVNEFLDDPETTWAMVKVLSQRGRGYDQKAVERILKLEEPKGRDRQSRIRALGFCRNAAALEKLEGLWRRCRLFRESRTVMVAFSRQDTRRYHREYLDRARDWLQDTDAVTDMTEDYSFDILAALSLCAKQNKKNYLQMLSAILASVPSDWISSGGSNGKYWNSIRDTVSSLWMNLSKEEKAFFRKGITSALHHLIQQALVGREKDRADYNQALRNFCRFFLLGDAHRDVYHCGHGSDLLKLFAKSIMEGKGLPLTYACQRNFLEFLDKHYTDRNMTSFRKTYELLMVLWYIHTDAKGQALLLSSEAYNHLVGTIPTNRAIDLQAILDGDD